MSLGSIQTRKMKDLHEYTANFYAIVVGSLVFGIWVHFTSEGLKFYSLFNFVDYLILFLLSIIQGMSVVSRTKAFKYEMPSRLSIIGYLSIVITLFIDIFIFGTMLNQYQILGLMIIFASIIASSIVVIRKIKQRRTA